MPDGVSLLADFGLSPPLCSSSGMATALEHPIFSHAEIQNNMEINPRRNSVEIIDVDAHDEHSASSSLLSQPPPRPRPALRPRHSFHPDAIISLVDDSDDEIEILSDPIPGSRQETSNRRRLRSPPPYSLMPTPPPPVPPIPRRYVGFTSLPAVRGAPPPFPAPPVRPNPQPFAFEQNLYLRDPSAAPSIRPQTPFIPRRTTVPQANTPQAAPHLPSMGLGGALISSNNVQLTAAHSARAARMSHVIRRRPMSWFVTSAPNLEELFLDDPDNPPQIRRWLEDQRNQFVRLYQHFRGPEDPQSQVKYYQRYTHPEQPEPGFTFDFAPNSSDEDSSGERAFPPTSANAPIIVDDDDEHPSTLLGGSFTSSKSSAAEPGKWTTILICAKCMEPLLLNDSLGPDDSGRRVWALRCGHMIDEQCLNDIGQPDEAEPDNQTQQPQQTSVDRKGKGKAKVKPKASYGEAVVEPIQSTNIRSRLRSAASSSSNSLSNQQPLPPPPPTKRRRTAAVVRKIEAEFEWKCPVPSCQLVHASVKIDGKWGPEKEVKLSSSDTRIKARGAIPVFA